MNKDTNVMECLNRSEVYGEYQKAFGEATELPLTATSARVAFCGSAKKASDWKLNFTVPPD